MGDLTVTGAPTFAALPGPGAPREAGPLPEAAEVTEALPKPAADAMVRCRACAHGLTCRSLAVQVAGAHEHTFRNPAGYSFHVLCYADAEGCLHIGTPTAEASWFAGFDWCFALCAECHQHVGWWYLPRDPGTGVAFAGLIATRLVRGT